MKKPRSQRLQTKRVLYLLKLLLQSTGPNKISEMIKLLKNDKINVGLSIRNIQRDIKFLRNVGFEIVSDKDGYGYWMKNKTQFFNLRKWNLTR